MGPFDYPKIESLLNSNQISGEDYALPEGGTEWLKISSVIHKAPFKSPSSFEPSPSSSNNSSGGGSNATKYVLAGCGIVSLLGIGTTILVIVVAVMLNGNRTGAANGESSESSLPASNRPADFRSLQTNAPELANFQATEKLEQIPVISGKVAIVEKEDNYVNVKGFNAYFNDYNDTDIAEYGLSRERMAVSPGEIDTLIRVTCRKGKMVMRYEKGVSGFSNLCDVNIIDFKNKTITAKAHFENAVPPDSIAGIYADSKKFVVLKPSNEIHEFTNQFPLGDLKNPTQGINYEGDPQYGPFHPLQLQASELSRTMYSAGADANKKISGKIAIVEKNPDGESSLKGFDVYGKELNSYEAEAAGIPVSQLATNLSEIDTLVLKLCRKGSQVAKVKQTTVYSTKCEVLLVDYKSKTIFAQNSFENRDFDGEVDTKVYDRRYYVLPPAEVDNWIKQYPRG